MVNQAGGRRKECSGRTVLYGKAETGRKEHGKWQSCLVMIIRYGGLWAGWRMFDS